MGAKKKTPVRATSSLITDANEFSFIGSISNITGALSMFEMGSIRRISKTIKREEFLDEYMADISSLYGINEGQAKLLKYLLSNARYHSVFRFDEEVNAKWAEATGMKATTVKDYFRSLVSRKRLIVKLKAMSYRINNEFLFHPSEMRVADFLSVHISYHFSDTGGVKSVKTDEEAQGKAEEISEATDGRNNDATRNCISCPKCEKPTVNIIGTWAFCRNCQHEWKPAGNYATGEVAWTVPVKEDFQTHTSSQKEKPLMTSCICLGGSFGENEDCPHCYPK